MRAIDWLKDWRAQLKRFQSASDMKQLHDWLWKSWNRDGQSVTNELNATLELHGDDKVHPDLPNLFAGRFVGRVFPRENAFH